jgi:hypothetical protein
MGRKMTEVEYKFPACSQPMVAFGPKKLGDYTVELTKAEPKQQSLKVSFEELNNDYLPCISIRSGYNVPVSGMIKYPRLNEVKQLVRCIQGMLAIETQIEVNLQLLHVTSGDFHLSIEESVCDGSQAPPNLKFIDDMLDIAPTMMVHEYALSFWRLGLKALGNQQPLEGFYYFWFFIEHSFGEGKFRQKSLTPTLTATQLLMKAIKMARQKITKETLSMLTPAQNKIYSEKTDEELVKYFVERRGELHHTKPNPDWHPGEPDQVRFDATFLATVCQHCVGLMASEKVEKK